MDEAERGNAVRPRIVRRAVGVADFFRQRSALRADMRGQAIFDAAPDLVSAAREIAQILKNHS